MNIIDPGPKRPRAPISITGWLQAVAGAGRGEWWGADVRMLSLLSKSIPFSELGLCDYRERLGPQTIFKATLLGVIGLDCLLWKISFRVKGS